MIKLRSFLAGLLMLAAVTLSARAQEYHMTLGVQSWTLRNLSFDQVVEFAVKHKIKYLELIGSHMNPTAPMQETARKKEILEKNGLVAYTFGVAGTSMNKDENRKLFEFAKFMGMKLIVVEPGDFKILDNLEELVKEYDIKIAIHYHGIKSMYGIPDVVKNLLQHRDKRMGVCLDAGWITSSRFEAAKVFKEYDGRVFDIHLKDKKVNHTDSGDVATDTFIGQGDTNFKTFFAALKDAKYSGVLAIETDNDLKDPTEHVTKALEYVDKNKP